MLDNKVERYAIRMANGSYIKQDIEQNSSGELYVKLRGGITHPIDGDLFLTKNEAERVLSSILKNDSLLDVVFDESNPPIEVVEHKIEFK